MAGFRVLVPPSLVVLFWVVIRALSRALLGSSSFLAAKAALSCCMRASGFSLLSAGLACSG